MTIKKYKRTISEEVEAVQYNGENDVEISVFVDGEVKKALVSIERQGEHFGATGIEIRTLTGFHTALVGDWIVRGFHGEIFCCANEVFVRDFEKASVEDIYKPSIAPKRCPSWCLCQRV